MKPVPHPATHPASPGAARPGAGDWLAWLAARLGAPGLLGLVLLLAALAAHVGLTEPLRRQASTMHARAEALAAQPRPAARARIEVARDFAQTLPAAQQDASILAGLFAAAEAAGLALDQGDYQLTVDRQAGLQRRRITLPVAGPYPALRAFLAEVLARYPSLGLDGLHLARDHANATEIKATLRFTLYLGETG